MIVQSALDKINSLEKETSKDTLSSSSSSKDEIKKELSETLNKPTAGNNYLKDLISSYASENHVLELATQQEKNSTPNSTTSNAKASNLEVEEKRR